MTEATYLRKVLDKLNECGYWIHMVDDGESEEKFKDTVALSSRPAMAVALAQDVEDATIYVTNGNKMCAIRVVWQGMGGDAAEVIADYSMSLDEIISSVEAN